MKGSTKVRLAMAGMALGAVAVAALPASADTGTASIAGTGTISPGLTQGGDPGQTFTFGGTGVAATVTVQGVLTCTVTGTDSIGSWSRGSGSFSGTCTVAGKSVSVGGSYDRTGAVVTVTGTASGGFSGTFGGGCAFSPTNVDVGPIPPVPPTVRITTFGVVCAFTIT